FGPILLGVFFNSILYGVLVVQLFVYFQTYKKDTGWIRHLMVYLFILETINTGFAIAMMYEPLVLRYGKRQSAESLALLSYLGRWFIGTPDATTFFPIALSTDPIITVLISTPVQIFIAWRIQMISKSRLLAGVICMLALVALGGGIWLTITVIHIRRFSRKPELHWPALTWLLASAITDVLITVTLTYNLSRRKTGFSSTDTAINKIIRLTIQTGLITTIFATLDVICFLLFPVCLLSNFTWDFALSKLYTNALVSTLNARSGWANNVLFSTGSEYLTTTGRVSFAVKRDSLHPHSHHGGDTLNLSRIHSPQVRVVNMALCFTFVHICSRLDY
ncbi:hypothetical protein AMATHDRAFT_151021, partial [Amanita thiersii Skay4041]